MSTGALSSWLSKPLPCRPLRWRRAFGSFGLEYDHNPLELYLGKHPVFHEGKSVSAVDSLYAEFRACLALGLDPDTYFAKDRFSRMFIVGGYIADSAIQSMRQYDLAKQREMEAKNKRRK